ncbi:hypothetical protein ACI2OX_03670 [Bacillus sp. N9]
MQTSFDTEFSEEKLAVTPGMDRIEVLHAFIKVISPAEVDQFLKRNIHTKEIGKTYERFLRSISNDNMFSDVFKRYEPSGNMFQLYIESITKSLQPLYVALKNEGEAIQAHFELLQSLSKQRESKQLFRVGVGIVGSLVAGPLGGIASRQVAKAMSSDKDYILASLNLVEEQWDHVVQAWETYLKIVRKNLKLLYAALIGGYFLRINEDLNQLGYEIIEFNRKKSHVVVDVKESERQRLIGWFNENRQALLVAIHAKQFSFSEKLSGNLLQYFLRNVPTGQIMMEDGRTLKEAASELRYNFFIAAIEEQYWSKGEYETAVMKYIELIKQIDTPMNTEVELDVPDLSVILFRVISYIETSGLHPIFNDIKAALYSPDVESENKTIHVLKAYELFCEKRELIDANPFYQELANDYISVLQSQDIEKDSFFRFLKRHTLYEKLKLTNVVKWIQSYENFSYHHRMFRLKVVIPALLFLFIASNALTVSATGKFFPEWIAFILQK